MSPEPRNLDDDVDQVRFMLSSKTSRSAIVFIDAVNQVNASNIQLLLLLVTRRLRHHCYYFDDE